MEKYIFTYIDDNHDGIFRDLTTEAAREVIDFLPSHKCYKSRVMRNIEKICLSYKLNKMHEVPFQHFFYNLENYDYSPANEYHMIVPSTPISKFTVEYLENFHRAHPNVHLYALITDSMHANSPHMDLVRNKLYSSAWDKVLTYDKYDAEEYGFTWFGYTYYSSFDDVEPDGIVSDIYYVGYDKGGRETRVLECYDYFIKNNLSPRFDVVSKNQNNKSNLQYMKNGISYPEVVSRLKSSNCILEILQENQKSQSIRYFEAVVYNKKLLTTNANIRQLPYYDSRYMRCFQSVYDIDVEWIRKREEIDYGYKGDFSPLGLVNFVSKYIEV